MGNCKKNNSTCCIGNFGKSDAKLIFIFDSPLQYYVNNIIEGRLEDILDSLFKETGINKQDCFFTALVHYPIQDKIKKEDIGYCAECLDNVLNSLKNKKYLVLCGNNVLKKFTGSVGINKSRGVITHSEKYNCDIFPIINPIALLRDIKHKPILIQDLCKLSNLIKDNNVIKKKNNYIYCDNLDLFNIYTDRLNQVEEFAIDVETTGLNAFDTKISEHDKLICFNFSWKENTGIVVPILKQEEYSNEKYKQNPKGSRINFWGKDQEYVETKLKKILLNNARKIGHNIKFDALMCRVNGYEINNIYFDTQLGYYLLNDNSIGMQGLKMLTSLYTDMGNYEAEKDKFFIDNRLKGNDFIWLSKEIMLKYGAADADCTLRLYHIFKDKLKAQNLEFMMYEIMMPLVRLFLDVEYNGTKINYPYLLEVKKDMQEKLKQLQLDIDKFTGGININSTKQLRELLFNVLKLKPLKQTEKGENSTDEESLVYLAKQNKEISKILDYRGLNKLYTTYVEGIEEKLDINDRVHPSMKLSGTVTGRLANQNPNLQQLPRDDKRIKEFIVAEKGCKILEADYSQIEFRMLAQFSKDPQMIQDIQRHIDTHKVVAAMSKGIQFPKDLTKEKSLELTKDITKAERQNAKGTVFGIMYGRGDQSIADEFNISLAEAQNIINTFFSRYQQAKFWIEKTKTELFKNPQLINLYGRRRRLLNINSPDSSMVKETLRQSINSVLQASASDTNCWAAIQVNKKIKELGMKSKLLVTVHDSQVYEVPDEEVEALCKMLRYTMAHPPIDLLIPLDVEIKMGDSWGSAKVIE